MAKILWLDRLVFKQIEQIKEDEKRESKGLYLMVEFPQVLVNSERYEVVYREMVSILICTNKYVIISKPYIC